MVGFGNVIVKLGSLEGSVVDPVSKTLGSPVRGGMERPDGKVIVKVNVALPVPAAFVALMVTLYGLPASVPAAGVPEISPVLVLTLRPAGNPVALKLLGLLVAVI